MKILGIDYGAKNIGIAISDEEQRIAFPKVVLKNDATFFSLLKEIIEKEDVLRIVLGESKDFKMKDNPIMKDVEKFKKDLNEKIGLEIVMFPEILTSHQAAKMMGEKNKMIDASAAAIILQSYLDRV